MLAVRRGDAERQALARPLCEGEPLRLLKELGAGSRLAGALGDAVALPPLLEGEPAPLPVAAPVPVAPPLADAQPLGDARLREAEALPVPEGCGEAVGGAVEAGEGEATAEGDTE